MSGKPSRTASRIIEAGALIAGYATFILSLLIAIEVVSRKLFNFSLQGVDEIGGYVLAIGVSFSLAYAFIMRAHTRVDVLLLKLGGRGQGLFNVLATLLIAALAIFFCWQSIRTLLETLEYGSRASTPLQTPLWIPQSLWVAGLAAFAAVTLAYALRGIQLLARGNTNQINRELGPRTAEEELQEALEDVKATTGEPRVASDTEGALS
ncbi:TRAP transporter small permease subunit [Pusillimonas sp. TS35]|uniref:TRAP transporter small permease subunit n=1 Tax=Paracandidimonas lactea TaxID=2895524 RepID=UPI001369FEBF|nr:TRAP transporter small permease [Paracandidimonas lactea]MYN14371.1 TRAP transporter small permease subunit [Pusillimonas sp. TS35]